MSLPIVSVLIPAYNAERYLPEALDSVLAQTWPNIDLIVVDDGSKDATLEIARSYEGRGMKVIAQENRGAAAARNKAFRASRGDYIQFFDADDVLAPDKIEQQLSRLMAEPAGSVATSAWRRYYESEFTSAPIVCQADYRDYDDPLDWRIQSWNGRGTMPPIAWLIPRIVAEEAGPWNPTLSLDDDGEYYTRVVLASRKRGGRIAFCSSAHGYYRSGHESLSSQRSVRALKSQFEVIRLSTERVLAVEDSPRTRHACACYWQSFLFMAYPQLPTLIRLAERRIEELGGGSQKAGVSRPFRLVRDMLGWKPALRLQRAYALSGMEASVQWLKKHIFT